MRIGVDGYNLAMPKSTGVATYAAELVRTLNDSGHAVDGIFGIEVPAEPRLRQAAFFDRYCRDATPSRRGPWLERRWSWAKRRVGALGRHCLRPVPIDDDRTAAVDGIAVIRAFDRVVTTRRLFEDASWIFARTGRFMTIRLPDPPAVMHWTYPLPIRLVGSRNVYTLHDLVPLQLPHTTLDDKPLYSRLVARCVSTAAQVCTVSEASRRDIIARFGVDQARVTNTYQAASLVGQSQSGGPIADAHAVEAVFGLKRRSYLLYYGAIEPKKNVGRLIEAYLSLRSDTSLVLVGAPAWQSEEELRLMPEGGASGAPGIYRGDAGHTILRLDYLPRELLMKLVRGAKVVVFPSLHEGFGLPVLEAMQLGTPVITSNTSSLPEVAGDAGLLVNPYDVGALLEAMHRVDTDEELRRTMSARGLERAKLFSRERYQERLMQLYAAAMGHP